MPRPAKSDKAFFVQQVRKRAHFTQKELARATGASERTVQRWENGRAWPDPLQWERILRAIHPRDRALATNVAEETRISLVALGLESPPAPIVAAPPPVASAPPPVPSAPPPVFSAPSPVVTPAAPVVAEPEPLRRPEPTLGELARIPLCRASEVAGLSPSVLRPVLKEALVSMRELGLSVEDAIVGLSK